MKIMFIRKRLTGPAQLNGSSHSGGFSILELLVIVAIIAILFVIAVAASYKVRDKARYSRSIEEFHQISDAMELYYEKNGDYPPDVTRDLPPGAEQYITGGAWPKAPYPNSVFDWEHWQPADLAYDPKQEVVQISIRFCPVGGTLDQCTIPNEPWAANFDANSGLYYCIKGPCRAHSSQPIDHPAYCVNC